ncbi:KxYKxGKxW signal peptide domain-containing protein [Limosilactobacillus secaliphilus]|nr:KxYKxGKxW signal peptide domain-containing protein [Limosilactobacillus secaliphilus]
MTHFSLENSTLHFKMYKSGKNWMVAGLMTTAVLAGLTLGNVNTTEAHAAVNNTPVAAAQKTSATSAEVQSQQTVVNSAATAVNSQTAVVASASSALASAQNLNSASAAVSGAEAQWSAAEKNAESARQAMGSASQNSQKAAKELKGATNLQHGFWKSKGSAAYDYLTNLVANTQKELDEAQAQLPDAETAWNLAHDAYEKALHSTIDHHSEEYKALKLNSEKAFNDLDAIQKTISTDKGIISSANAKLNGKANLADGTPHNLIKNKALVDSIPALQEAAQKAHNAYVAASDAASDASVIAYNALDNISAVRDAYNLPDSNGLKKMRHDAMGAPRKINSDKTEINALRTADQTYYGDAVKYASEAAIKEGQAQSAVAKAESDVAVAADQLDQAETQQKAAQAKYDANKTSLNLTLLNNAKSLTGSWQRNLHAANTALETAKNC